MSSSPLTLTTKTPYIFPNLIVVSVDFVFLSSSSSCSTSTEASIHSSNNDDSMNKKQMMYNYLDRSNQYLAQIQNQNSNHPHEHPITTRTIPASKEGLDPTTNRFHPPIVYHPNYSPPPSSSSSVLFVSFICSSAVFAISGFNQDF